MQVEIKLDESCTEPKIVIYTASMSEDVQTIVHTLTDSPLQILFGKQGEKIQPLIQENLIRVYAAGGKVFAVTDSGEYTLRQRLYELESRLPPSQFVRISNSEIINLKKVDHFDLNFAGTICVKLSDGSTTYVSRRYVSKLKKRLEL